MSSSRRRGSPWWLLVVAFVVVPLVEIFVIVQIGQVIGAWWTILLLVVDSVIGAWLVKREGLRAWRALGEALRERRMPARELADGMLILVGGTLMLTPGFVTDLAGVLCILPVTRPIGRRVLTGVISRKLAAGAAGFPPGSSGFPPGSSGFPPGFGPGFGTGFPTEGTADPRTQQRPGPVDPDFGVVQGEVVDEERPEGHPPSP